MNDYMRALHQRFFREPDCTEIRRELETLRLTLRDKLDRQDREADEEERALRWQEQKEP